MTVRLLDAETRDIVTSGVQFTNKAEEIGQTVATRLRLFLGEVFRDIKDGTPWWESILGKQGTLASKEAIIKSRILRTEGVIRLVSFSTSFELNTRVYSVSAGILTKYGETEITVTM